MKHNMKPVLGAFDQGLNPTIVCINWATVDLGVDFSRLITSMQAYIDICIAPHWGVSARLIQSDSYIKGAWAMVFIDDADVAGALAYHDLTPDGFPLSKVFVKTTLNYGELVSVSASHELVEMLVDPAINMMTTGPNTKTMYAYETADPVEALSFDVDGVQMSDFVYPAYFESFRVSHSAQFDHMNQVTRPFQILPGGYQIIFKNSRWSQIFGSKLKERTFKKEDRRGHRSEARKRKVLTRVRGPVKK